jgi:hypothetical protein
MSKSSFNLIISLLLIFLLTSFVWGQTRVGKFGVGVDGSGQMLMGAGATNPSLGLGGGISLSYSIMEYFGVRGKFAMNQLSWKGSNSYSTITDLMTLNLYASADLMPNSNINPFIVAGGGMVFFDPKLDNGTRAPKSSSDMNFMGGAGVDYFLNEFWSITLMGEYVITGSPYFAGSYAGSVVNPGNDSFLRGSLQIRYYFFDSAFITRLLDAQRERSKRSK